MPAKNLYHDLVLAALIDDGWTITHDPYYLSYGSRDLYIDLAAERGPIGAEKDGKRIAVEVQSFLGPSPVADLQRAIGQFMMYRLILTRESPGRSLYLAIPRAAYDGIISEPLGIDASRFADLQFVVFDPHQPTVLQWIK